MTAPVLTICLGVKDWYLDHLERCLGSLRAQCDAPIVVADLSVTARSVGRVATVYGATTVAEPQEIWSRARALNRAAARAETPWLVFTDADMIFPPTWWAAVMAALAAPVAGAEPVCWLTRSRDIRQPLMGFLPPDGVLSAEVLVAMSDLHPTVGQGAGMIVPRRWFEEVGGFDETYQTWGGEDNDLTLRVEWAGGTVQWLPDPTRAFAAHQWHDRTWPTHADLAQVDRNRAYLAARIAAGGPIARNRAGKD